MAMALEIPLRLIAVLLPPLLIFVCLTIHPGLPAELALWLGWLALALAMDALTPPVTDSPGPGSGDELVHRRSPALRGAAQAFMLLVCYPHFPMVHLRVHHPHVGTALDPGTSRLNESLGRFLGRAHPLSWRSAWRVEAARLAVKQRPRWHPRNRLLRVVALQAVVLGAVLAAFGSRGLALFVAQSAV